MNSRALLHVVRAKHSEATKKGIIEAVFSAVLALAEFDLK